MEIKNISDYKRPLMGFAALAIVIAHCAMPNENWLYAQRLFGWCVELFLILSGFGCYYSIQKRTTKEFFKRRFQRILPVYLIILIAYGVYVCGRFDQTIGYYLLHNEAFTSLILYGEISGWFVVAITCCYLLTPAINKLLQKNIAYAIWLLVLIWVISAQFDFYLTDQPYMINNFIIVRIPAYIFGMILGNIVEKTPNASLSMKGIICGEIITIGIYILNAFYNTTNYGYIVKMIYVPFAFFSAMLLCKLFANISTKALSFVGLFSLEIYLMFEKILGVFMWDIGFVGGYFTTNLLAAIITFILAIILRLIVNLIIDKQIKLY